MNDIPTVATSYAEMLGAADAVSADVCRNIEIQAREAVYAAIDDWRAASGSGAYRITCARYGLRCFSAWHFHWKRTRETTQRQRAA